jgi:hypothetical protein
VLFPLEIPGSRGYPILAARAEPPVAILRRSDGFMFAQLRKSATTRHFHVSRILEALN